MNYSLIISKQCLSWKAITNLKLFFSSLEQLGG
jgi:hypothetical protein